MFGTLGTLALVLTMQTAGGQAPASNQQPRDAGGSAPRRLTVTYSDGTSKTRLLTPRGGSWTPYFPHRPDAPSQDGLPLNALDVSHVEQLRRVLTILGETSTTEGTVDAATIAQIRRAIAALPVAIDRTDGLARNRQLPPTIAVLGGQQQVKQAVLDGLDGYLKSTGNAGAGPQQCVAGARMTYSAWLRRTGQP